jgi:hypothetical protein
LSQPLPMRGTVQTTATGDSRPPNRYGTAVAPTAADAWHRPNDGDWGQSLSQSPERRLSQPLRNGGCPNRCGCVAPPKRRPMRGTVQTTATEDSRPPNRYGRAVVPTAAERRPPQPLPMRGTVQTTATGDSRPPNRCGTAVVPTTTKRRSSQPLREGGCPNRCGRAVAPTAADAWHRPNDGDWGQSPSQPLRNGGCPNHYGTAVVPTATGGRLSQPLQMRGTVQTTATGDSRPPNRCGTAVAPTAADTSLSL